MRSQSREDSHKLIFISDTKWMYILDFFTQFYSAKAADCILSRHGGGDPSPAGLRRRHSDANGGRAPACSVVVVANEEYDVSRRRFPSARWQCPVAVGEMVVAGGRAPARW